MAFNWPTFWTRAFTALVFAAVIAAGFLYNQWGFFVLISVIHFGCWYEFLRLIEKIHSTKFHAYCKLGFYLVGFHILLLFCNGLYIGNYEVKPNFSLPFLIAGLVLLIIGIFKQGHIKLKALGAGGLGWLYISLCLGLFLSLRFSNIPIIREGQILWGRGNGFYIPIIILLAI